MATPGENRKKTCGLTGILSAHARHMVAACKNSLSGLKIALHEEKAFQQIALGALAGIPLALWLADSWVEGALLVLPLVIAIIVELLNTALENVVDLASPHWHELAKKAKDTASAAQFCAQLLAGAMWGTYIIARLLS